MLIHKSEFFKYMNKAMKKAIMYEKNCIDYYWSYFLYNFFIKDLGFARATNNIVL